MQLFSDLKLIVNRKNVKQKLSQKGGFKTAKLGKNLDFIKKQRNSERQVLKRRKLLPMNLDSSKMSKGNRTIHDLTKIQYKAQPKSKTLKDYPLGDRIVKTEPNSIEPSPKNDQAMNSCDRVNVHNMVTMA